MAVCAILLVTVGIGLPSRAYAADGDELALHAQSVQDARLDLGLSVAVTSDDVTTQAETKQPAQGNLDAFIGLPKKTLVMAIGKGKKTSRIYKSASKKSKRISGMRAHTCLVVDTSHMKKGTNYTWIKVKLRGKARGYVKVSTVKLQTIDTRTFGLDLSKKSNRRRVKVCRYALPYLGTPWTFRGVSMKYGVDCSRMVCKALRKGGYKVANTTAYALSKRGKAISKKKLKPGDVLFYRRGKKAKAVGHCAIYLGNGFIINSSGHFGHHYPDGGVSIYKMNYRTPHASKFRRYIKG